MQGTFRISLQTQNMTKKWNKSTILVTLTIVKIHLNSTISNKDARYITVDIKDFYYRTLMQDYKYSHLSLKLVPKEVIEQYNLHELASNNKVYFDIQKGMLGLKQVGIIAYNRLQEHLMKYDYFPCHYTPSLWKHKYLPISFTLVVDDLGIKYIKKRQQNIC